MFIQHNLPVPLIPATSMSGKFTTWLICVVQYNLNVTNDVCNSLFKGFVDIKRVYFNSPKPLYMKLGISFTLSLVSLANKCLIKSLIVLPLTRINLGVWVI